MKIQGITDFDFDLATFSPGEVPVWDPVTKTFVGMTAAQALGYAPENAASKNQANGYAGLSGAGKLSPSQMPTLPTRQQLAVGALAGVLGSVLLVSYAAAQTDADTSEKTLWGFNLPAGVLDADGRVLRVTAFGDFAANANTKSVKLKLDTATLASASAAVNGEGWELQFTLVRVSEAGNPSGRVQRRGFMGSSLIRTASTTTAADWTLAHAISVTGQNGAASAGDILFRGAIVEALN
ncbi:MAG TPA: hypothetical protein VF762_11010 [Blastocatellia bacterium]